MSQPLAGTIVAAFGRHYEVETADGSLWQAVPKAKRSIYACGDRVELEALGGNQARLARHLPRTSLLYRSDAFREKLIAANPTQVVLVVASEPGFNDELLSRALVAVEHDRLRAIIVLNKSDLVDLLPAARARVAPFAALGYTVIETSAKESAAPLRPYLAGHLSVLVGQSGMGKSTLINALVPGAAVPTREISTALDSGKHTTTYARLYRLDVDSAIIDSPGLQEFGLAHLSRGDVENAFVEFRADVGGCRFRDCRHEAEPDCAIKAAVAAGRISTLRQRHFLSITAALARSGPASAT